MMAHFNKYHTSKHVQRTLDDVCNSRAMGICRDRHADSNLNDSCQYIVRFVSREAFIESVNLEVFMIVVWTALEASLRKFYMLQ